MDNRTWGQVLAAVTFFLHGCDGLYVVKGFTLAPVSPQPPGSVSGVVVNGDSVPLPGVTITLHYPPEDGPLPRAAMTINSDAKGQYYRSFVGPPWRLPRNTFVEFDKHGYRSVRVYLEVEKPPPGVEILTCTKEEDTPCWQIKVVMLPSSSP